MYRLIFGFAIAFATLGVANPADAAVFFVTAGNTHPTQAGGPGDAGVNAVVDYAILQNDGSGWGSFSSQLGAYGGGNLTLDNSATYLYLFQVVNDANRFRDLFINFNTTPPGFLTSQGYFGGTGFSYSGTPITPTDPSIGTLAPAVNNGTSTSVLPTGNLSNVNVVAITSGFSATNPPTYSPTSLIVNPSSIDVQFQSPPSFDSPARSYLFGFTSNFGPIYGTALAHDGQDALGGIPVPGIRTPANAFPMLPEPASMTLWGLGMALCCGVGYWRKRREAVVA